MKVKAFRLSQKSTDLYLTVLPASELMAHAKADVWDPKTNKGYQRQISVTRANKAGKYLVDKTGLFPQSVVLNVRGNVSFKQIENFGIFQYGELEIPASSMPLWEVDGQHRIKGLEYAIKKNPAFSNYPVNVTFLNLKPDADKVPFAEMKQFYVTNTEMRGVRADLAQQLISEIVAKEGEKEHRKPGRQRELLIHKAKKIVDLLNAMEGQPWHGAIQLANEEKQPRHRIAHLSFIVSLKPVLRNTEGYATEEAAKILADYWSAVRELYPSAFEKPADYLIQKTLGVFVFHLIFPRVFALCRGDFTKSHFKKILSKIAKAVPADSWNKNGEYKPYGGMKGFNYLAIALEEYLD